MTIHADVKQMRERLAASGSAVRFQALDSWRGIAALMVVLFHAQIASHVYDARLVVAGDAFVDFFFVLSGFVIAHAYLNKLDSGEGVARFLFLRIGRLYPLHLFMLGLFVAFELARLVLPLLAKGGDAPFGEGSSITSLLGNVLMLQAFYPFNHLSWNAPSWSISAELLAYTLFTLLVFAMPNRLLKGLALSALLAVAALMLFSARGMETAAGLGWPRAIYGFALGAMLYRMCGAGIVAQKRLAGTAPRVIWTTLELAAASAALAAVVYGHGTPLAWALPPIFVAVVGVFAVEGGWVSRALKCRPLIVLGALSYSIYLTHLFVLSRFGNAARVMERVLDESFMRQMGTAARGGLGIDAGSLLAGDLVVLLVLGSVIAMSWLTYRFVELPGQNLFRNGAKWLFDGPARGAGRDRAAMKKGRLQQAAF